MKKQNIFNKISNINSNKLTSMLALLISLGTFALLFYEIKLTREQQYVSVLPYLSFSQSMPNDKSYEFDVYNAGIGPAFIENVKYIINGKEYGYNAFHIFLDYNKLKEAPIYASGLAKGVMIPSDRQLSIIGTISSEELATKLKDFLTGDSMTIEIIYSSVYGEKWILNSKEGVTKIND